MRRQIARRSCFAPICAVTWAAVVHSSSLRPVMRIRQSVTAIAWSDRNDSCSRYTMARSQRPAWSLNRAKTPCAAPRRRPRARLPTRSTNSWPAGVKNTRKVQNQAAPGSISHPVTAKRSVVGETRLRRKLSMIFQRSIAVSGFVPLLPSNFGTICASHGKSCQSPRIQRCSRLAYSR